MPEHVSEGCTAPGSLYHAQIHHCFNVKTTELCPWYYHPASPMVPTMNMVFLRSQLLDCDYNILFQTTKNICSLCPILSIYFRTSFHQWYFSLWKAFTLHIWERISALHMHEVNSDIFLKDM